MYLSTHNALRAGEIEYPKFDMTFYDMRAENQGREKRVTLSISPLHDVQAVKRLLIRHSDLPKGTQVKDIRIIYKGVDLPNYRLMNTFAQANRRLYWSLTASENNADLREIGFKLPKRLQHIFDEVRLAFRNHTAPKLSIEGTGGTYFMYNLYRKKVAIFKPSDEEAFAPCNPRGYEGCLNQRGFRAGVLSSEGASREVTAYLLDLSYSNFSGVPETSMIECCHPNFCYKDFTKDGNNFTNSLRPNNITWKAGSFQEFIDAKESCGNYDARLFSICDVHRIGILDIFVMNLDRNDGNILVAPLLTPRDLNTMNGNMKPGTPGQGISIRGGDGKVSKVQVAGRDLLTPEGKNTKYRLIPIDHGLILPDVMDVANIDLVWFNWPQAKVPFEEAELDIIFMLDSDRDAERLKRKLFIRDECLRTMKVTTRLLQIGAKMHLTLHELAKISCREDIDEPSALERLVEQAIGEAYNATKKKEMENKNNRLVVAMDLAVTNLPLLKLSKASEATSQSSVREAKKSEWQSGSGSERDVTDSRMRETRVSREETTGETDGSVTEHGCISERKEVGESNTGAVAVSTGVVGSSNTGASEAPVKGDNNSWSTNSSWSTSTDESEDSDMEERSAACVVEGVENVVDGASVSCTEKSAVKIGGPIVEKKTSFDIKDEPQEGVAELYTKKMLGGDSVECAASIDRGSSRALPSSAFFVYEKEKKKKKGRKANRQENAAHESGGIPFLSSLTNADNLSAVTRGTRIGTARRLQGSTVRGTTYRQYSETENQTWCHRSSDGRTHQINWDDQNFENQFLESFECCLRRHIHQQHPNWMSYKFNGDALLQQLAHQDATQKNKKMTTRISLMRNRRGFI